MSWEAQTWALKDAPTDDPAMALLLVAMGEAADADGCGAFRSVAEWARSARIAERTVQRRLNALQGAGLIGLGDQRMNEYLPRDRRPVVWDLLIPFAWYGSKIGRINEMRAQKGREPLTPRNRPSNRAGQNGVSDSHPANGGNGVTTGHPVHVNGVSGSHPAGGNGVTSRHPAGSRRGDSQTVEPLPRGDCLTPNPKSTTTTNPSQLSAPATAGDDDDDQTTVIPMPERTPKLKRATPAPAALPMTPDMREWLKRQAPNVADPERETEQMLDHYRGKGEPRKDWVATWRTWMRKASDGGRAARTGPQVHTDQGWRDGTASTGWDQFGKATT